MNSPAVVGRLERGVRPLAVRLASQLQTAAYSHGYEDGHPSNAATRQAKYSDQAQRLRAALCEEIERLYAAEAKTNSYIVDNARLAEKEERMRAALEELRDRIKGHPAYADLTEEEEIETGGDTAELSYLARVADAALGA